jgi:RNA polymerase sigma-70 factor (ECF subfamily)
MCDHRARPSLADLLLLSAAVNSATASEASADASSFERLIRPHLDALFMRALRFERRPVEASDLVQDTLERGLRRRSQFRPGSNVRVWLFTIMFHLFIDRCRRRSHERVTEHVEAEELVAPEPGPDDPWQEVSADQVQHALERLGSPFREIVELHWVHHCSYREISQQLRIPVSTVGTRLLRARKKLRLLLVEEAPILTEVLGSQASA